MKKAVLLVLVAFTVLSCALQPTANNLMSQNEAYQTSLSNYKRKEIEHRTVVILKTGLPEDWIKKTLVSAPYLTNENLKYRETDEVYFIDLDRIPFDDYQILAAQWIKENRSYIDYIRTGEFTERAHFIRHPEEISAIYPVPQPPPATQFYSSIKFSDLKDIIVKEIDTTLGYTTTPSGTNHYKDDKYGHYLQFYKRKDGQLGATVVNDFTNTKHLFSIPMLRSIFDRHKPADDKEIVFGIVTFGETFPFLYVEVDNLHKYYYDYSNEPR